MASHLAELINQNISIITNDGRNIIGHLKGYDQCINVILEDSFERVYSTKEDVEIVDLGLYIIRGDNIAIVGEIDPSFNIEKALNDKSRAEPLKPVVH